MQEEVLHISGLKQLNLNKPKNNFWEEKIMDYTTVGKINKIIIKWHPIYEYSLWFGDRCLSEHSTLVECVKELEESYSQFLPK